jgi:MoxR-like ATPase
MENLTHSQSTPATHSHMSNTPPTAAQVATALGRVKALEAHLNAIFYERGPVIEGLFTAMVAGEHLALIGSPGIAKSAVLDEFARGCRAKKFSYLMSRFTEPNELFGAVDIKAYKERGIQRRNTAGMLPEAEVASLDEAFKANSAILNALLKLMNERKFSNGEGEHAVPLHSMLLASNEIPTDSTLAALWDRCMVRLVVSPIKDDSNWDAMCFNEQAPTAPPDVTLDDFRVLGAHARTLPYSPRVAVAARAIRAKLAEKSITATDRRWKKAMRGIVPAYAALRGSPEVTEEHVDVLRYVLWSREDQIPTVDSIVEENAAAWIGAVRDLTTRLDEVTARLNAARAMSGGARLRALADLSDLIEPLGGEAITLHKQYGRKETEALVKRAGDLTADSVNAARPGGR